MPFFRRVELRALGARPRIELGLPLGNVVNDAGDRRPVSFKSLKSD